MDNLQRQGLAYIQSLVQKGDFAAAERACLQLHRQFPDNLQILFFLGGVCLENGKPHDAAKWLSGALNLAADRPAHMVGALGVAYLESGDHARALPLLEEAVEGGLDDPPTIARLAFALRRSGDWQRSLEILRQACKNHPADVMLLLNLGNAEAAAGQNERALSSYDKALSLSPENPDVLFNLATVLMHKGDYGRARQIYEQCLHLDPANPEVLCNLGLVLERTGQFEAARQAYLDGLKSDPDSPSLQTNMASVCRAMGAIDEAEVWCRRVLTRHPDWIDARISLAGIKTSQGDLVAARAEYEQAIQTRPDDPAAHCQFGMYLLLTGDLDRGWEEYRYRPTRLALEQETGPLCAELPRDMLNARVVLLGEQGIGDQLFFMRWIPRIVQKGGGVAIACNPKMHSLLRGTGLFRQISSDPGPGGGEEIRIALGDLPFLLRDEQADTGLFPKAFSLQPDPMRVAAIKDRLSQLASPPFVGLAWRAGTRPEQQSDFRNRSLYKQLPVDEFAAAVGSMEGTFLNLQRELEPAERELFESVSGRQLLDFSSINENLEDLLALLSLLDDYVGVSSTNVHLLASLGKGGRVFVPNPPDWRWMASGSFSPWFSGFSVYRQSTSGDWGPGLNTFTADLGGRGQT